MTPAQFKSAATLVRDYQRLCDQLEHWKHLEKPPQMVPDSWMLGGEQSIPPGAWSAFRAACMKHVEDALAANLKAFEAL